MSTEINYNLPGFGFASCYLFDTAAQFMDLFDKHDLIEKTKMTCQLGTMKYVYPGAHHTRYEYIFSQLMLISNVTVAKGNAQCNVDISLGCNLNEFESFSTKATGSDIMQCLAILSNVGHMYDTFTSTKILTKLLQKSKKCDGQFYAIFKRNLPKELHISFDDLLNKSNYYKLHLYNMIHLLKGMANTKQNEDLCCFGIKILSLLINPDLIKNDATARIFYLYKKIRKIAYLSVDMIYTPASFGANLDRMLYMIPTYVDELFIDDSPMNQAILQLEDIIHRQIYDSPKCILNSTRIEQENFDLYCSAIGSIKNIYDIRNMIREFEKPFDKLHSTKQPKVMKKLIDNSELCLAVEANNIKDILNYDNSIIKSLPTSRIVFGTQLSQNLSKITSAFGLLSREFICQDSQTILYKVLNTKLYDATKKDELIKFAIKSLFKYNDFYFKLSSPSGLSINDCIIIGNGCKNVAKKIKNSFSINNVPDKNKLHEILSCAIILEQMEYSGLVLCFVGGIKANEFKKTQNIDELDGLIYFPSRESKKPFAVIVEAKNNNKGETEAEAQLSKTLPLLSACLTSSIRTLKRCAFLELSIT